MLGGPGIEPSSYNSCKSKKKLVIIQLKRKKKKNDAVTFTKLTLLKANFATVEKTRYRGK